MNFFNRGAEQPKQILHFDPDREITQLLQEYLPATIPGARVSILPVHQFNEFILLSESPLDVVVFGLNEQNLRFPELRKYNQIFLEMINRQLKRARPTEFVLHLPFDPEYDKPEYFFVGRAEPIVALAARVRQALGLSLDSNWQ